MVLGKGKTGNPPEVEKVRIAGASGGGLREGGVLM